MGYIHSALVVGVAVFLQTVISDWWTRFKAREALKPQTMKLKNGIYVPSGRVQKIDTFLKWEFRFGMAWLGFWVLALAYAVLFDPSLIHHGA